MNIRTSLFELRLSRKLPYEMKLIYSVFFCFYVIIRLNEPTSNKASVHAKLHRRFHHEPPLPRSSQKCNPALPQTPNLLFLTGPPRGSDGDALMRCNASLCALHIVHSGINALTIVHPVQGGSCNLRPGFRVQKG